MSLPVYEIFCTGCQYQTRFGYNVSYQVSNEALGVQPDLKQGWCVDCQMVVTIYVPRPSERLKEDAELASAAICEAEAEVKTWLSRLLKRQIDKEMLARCQLTIERYNKTSLYFSTNSLAKRCLTCGGRRVSEVSMPALPADGVWIGAKHMCGGEIHSRVVGRVSVGKRPVVVFDVNGNLVSDERISGGKSVPTEQPTLPGMIEIASIKGVLEDGNFKAFVICARLNETQLRTVLDDPEAKKRLVDAIDTRIGRHEYLDPTDGIDMVREAREMTNWTPNTDAVRILLDADQKPCLSWRPC